ncbi:MAG: response regulator [Sphingomonas sp.]|uniref:response regulator n=1 Tax=Sphingomonas sp. TaxID=28214 RepID=UPI003F80097E
MTETINPVIASQVVIVEDDDALRRSLQLLLTGLGYEVLAFSRPKAAMASPAAAGASRLVIDYILPQSDGIETLRILRARGWQGRAVLITALHSPQLRRFALNAGFAAVLAKPFRSEELIRALAISSCQIGEASARAPC